MFLTIKHYVEYKQYQLKGTWSRFRACLQTQSGRVSSLIVMSHDTLLKQRSFSHTSQRQTLRVLKRVPIKMQVCWSRDRSVISHSLISTFSNSLISSVSRFRACLQTQSGRVSSLIVLSHDTLLKQRSFSHASQRQTLRILKVALRQT